MMTKANSGVIREVGPDLQTLWVKRKYVFPISLTELGVKDLHGVSFFSVCKRTGSFYLDSSWVKIYTALDNELILFNIFSVTEKNIKDTSRMFIKNTFN